MKGRPLELMAPAGSFPALTAACKAGADAVYFGLDIFSMRAGRRNFKVSDLERIRKICDSYPGKPKMYLALNTIIYDSELKKLERLVKRVVGKVDAVICWDLAVIDLCKRHKIPFFISTQASVSNKVSAEFYKKLGAKRVVLARELDIKQIKEISKVKGLEIEAFVHGAMCVSISGRCFTSQFLFNRSANRGECFHPCRRPYTVIDDRYGRKLKLDNHLVMSAKDLCALPLIEKLKKAGVMSYKIEGRNRDPLYVETAVRVYREALDNKITEERTAELMDELEAVYNKGFSTGFYLGGPMPDDYSKVENSASKFYRSFLGKIVHVYPRSEAATVKLSDTLKVGDKIAVFHDRIGAEKMNVIEIEIDRSKVKEAEKGKYVGIKFPFKVYKNAEIYKILLRDKHQ